MKQPVISVLLPVFNASSFVKEAIDSILAQDFREFELLIADDGSTDDSLTKIRSYSDERIRIIINPQNLGLIATLNKLLHESKGEFIARMDADDVSHPSRFTEQLKAFRSHPSLGLVSSFMGMINEPAVIIKHHFLSSDEIKGALPFTNPIVHPAVMFRSSLLPTRELYNTDYLHAEDYGLWMELAGQMDFKVLPLPLISHRAHSGQVSVNHYDRQKKSVSKAHWYLFNKLGINPSEAELQLHFSLFLEQFQQSEEYIDQVDAWLSKLVTLNRSAQVLPVAAFENAAGEWWFRLNQFLAAKGVGSRKRYKRSELSEMFTPSLGSSAKLFARSILTGKKPQE